jgi:hypothetical protein
VEGLVGFVVQQAGAGRGGPPPAAAAAALPPRQQVDCPHLRNVAGGNQHMVAFYWAKAALYPPHQPPQQAYDVRERHTPCLPPLPRTLSGRWVSGVRVVNSNVRLSFKNTKSPAQLLRGGGGRAHRG